MGFFSALQHSFALWGLKRRGAKFIEKRNIALLDGSTIDAYVYENDDFLLGQIDISGKMFINKNILSFSPNGQQSIFLHERGHQKLHPIIKYPVIIIIVFCAILSLLMGFATILFGLFSIGYFLITQQTTFYLFLLSLFSTAYCIIGYIIFQFFNEGFAEYYALKYLGVENFLLAAEERKKAAPKPPLREIVFVRLSYPPRQWVVWIYCLFNKK